MHFDVAYVWSGAGIGWFLVTLVLAARRPKTLLAAIIPWIVGIDVFAILDSAVTQLLRHLAHGQTIGFAFLVLPYAMLLWLLSRLLFHPRGTNSNDPNA